MPEKVVQALHKAWGELTEKEREMFRDDLIAKVGIGAGAGSLLAMAVTQPQTLPATAPTFLASLSALLLLQMEQFSKGTRKFAQALDKYLDEPIHSAIEKLKKVI